MDCLICKSARNKTVFTEDGIDVKKCSNCGHIFSTYVQKDFYAGYYPESLTAVNHHWWLEAHRLMYRKFWNRLMKKNSGCLLDVGCGLGYFLKEVSSLDKNNQWRLYGAETSYSAVDFSRRELGLSNIFLGPIEKSPYEENYFDLVTLWDLIEHLEDPRRSLARIFKVLKMDGRLFISTPNIKIQLPKARFKKFLNIGTEHCLEARDHLHDYSPRSLQRLIKESGFTTIEFIQLPPIQSVSGSPSKTLKLIKNIWFCFSCLIFYLSFRQLNFNNLYVVAHKN